VLQSTVDRCERYALVGRSGRRWYRIAREVIRRLVDYHLGKPDNVEGINHNQQLYYETLCDLV
jgi:hypothetical protein